MKQTYIVMMIIISLCGLVYANTEVLSQTESRIVVKIDTEGLQIVQNEFTSVSIPDFAENTEAGAPSTPSKEIRVAVPPGGSVSVNIISQETYVSKINSRLQPVQTIVEAGKTHNFLDIINESKYREQRSEIAVTSELRKFRFQEYYAVTIFPVLYDDAGLQLTVFDEIVLEITINGDTSYRKEVNENIERIYEQIFINYDDARYWRNKKTDLPKQINFAASDYWYKFNTSGEGIYTLTFTELEMLPGFCNPNSLRLFTSYKNNSSLNDFKYEVTEIPFFMNSGDELKENSELIFEQSNPNFFQHHTYWLTFGGEYANEPQRLAIIPTNSDRNEVLDFTKYIPKNMLNSREQADCLIIYPEEFISQANELISFHSRNFEVNSIACDQQGIFDKWTGGVPEPEAIRAHIDSIFNKFEEPAIQYVILLGSGTNDWDNPTEKNKIVTFNGIDDNFVSFSGVYSDPPDIAISRFPAQNVSDMNFMLERLEKYVEQPTLGWWRNKILLVADDENKDGGLEGVDDGVGPTHTMNHTRFAQETQELLNRSVVTDKVLGIEYDFDEYQNKPDARNEMIRRVNEGRLIWYYVGHGNPDVMGDEDYFRGSHHLQLLDNEESGARPARLPLHISASCSVGQFDEVGYDSLGEKLVLLRNGGAISCIAASRACQGTPNTTLIKQYLIESINEKESVGMSLFIAKWNSGASIYNSKKFVLFGDPVMTITTPSESGFTDISEPVNVDSLQSGQLVKLNIDYEIDYPGDPVTELRVLGSDIPMHYDHTIGSHTYSVDYTRNGKTLFNGSSVVPVTSHPAYVVPFDVRAGDAGRIINYYKDDIGKQDFVCLEDDIKYSPIPLDTENNDVPQIDVFLGSEDFITGDYVSSSPALIINIADENGINTTGSSGHDIMYILDNNEPVPITEYFVYDFGEYKSGNINLELADLTEGFHRLKVIAFDSFNSVSVSETEFYTKSSGGVAIEKVLPYPNPMESEGNFTFIITEDSEVTISIFTISGRKIRTLRAGNLSSGFNKVYWNCKDQDGDEIANGTYFYKIKAGKTEKTGKVIILK